MSAAESDIPIGPGSREYHDCHFDGHLTPLGDIYRQWTIKPGETS
jgi:hypothetical protein